MKLNLYILCTLMLISATVLAQPLPLPVALEKLINIKPVSVRVYEPHLSVDGSKVAVEYIGFPIEPLLAKWFGSDWATTNGNFDFYAQDGYVSSIEAQRLNKYKPYLAFRRADHKAFSVDNVQQHQKNVPLAPYYLVWENISNDELFKEGAYHWPYQVIEIKKNSQIPTALIPNKLNDKTAKQIKLAQQYCLTCHQINGFGGKKSMIELVDSTKKMSKLRFIQWVISPQKIKPGTSMAPINTLLPLKERIAIALQLHEYLMAFKN